MQSFGEISKSTKPDKKIRDMVGETIEIESLQDVEMEYKGEKTTFHNLILTDGTRVSCNETIAKQVKAVEADLPFTAVVSEARSKKGKYYLLK